MKTSTFFNTGFFILLVLNIIAITLLILGRPQLLQARMELKDRIARELRFDAEQKKTYFSLIEEYQQAMSELNQQQQSLSAKYFDRLKEEGQRTESERLRIHIAQMEAQKMVITYNHFLQIKGICSLEQLSYFPKVVDRTLEPMLFQDRGRDMPPPEIMHQ